MKIYSGIHEFSKQNKNGIVSIGVFDGFHIGHQALINDMVNIASENNFESFVLTFRVPPRKDDDLNILELNDKLSFIENIGISGIILCDFDDTFSSLEAKEFVELLKNNYKIHNYYIGSDFHFGFNKKGSLDFLKQEGYNVYLEETLKIDGKKVSTSEIKKYIKSGEINGIEKLLGRPFYIKGMVKMGKQLGRVLGYPTMNILNSEVMYPANGAYITTTEVEGYTYKSMTFVDSSIIETHLFGFNKYAYNFLIKINFIKKIRDNFSFADFSELKMQLKKDVMVTKQFFDI